MLRTAAALSFCLFMSACVVDMATSEQDLDSTDGGGAEPAGAKVFHAKGQAGGGGGGSPDLIWHNGPVMTQGAYVEPIFWGTSWSNASFVADKITGIQSFYGGMGGTGYAATNSEYTDSTGNVSTAVTVGPSHVDTSAAAKNGSRTSTILAEVCKQITNPVPNGYYPVYIDNKRGHAGYCAWHSSGTCGGVTVQFAFFFNLDGDSGCDPQAGGVGGHSDGLAALANVSGHELSEAVTDPHLNAWYDSSGAENSDKCAWSFGSNSISFKNGTQWKIQGNWSNYAYDHGTGYASRDGLNGCLDGQNYK